MPPNVVAGGGYHPQAVNVTNTLCMPPSAVAGRGYHPQTVNAINTACMPTIVAGRCYHPQTVNGWLEYGHLLLALGMH